MTVSVEVGGQGRVLGQDRRGRRALQITIWAILVRREGQEGGASCHGRGGRSGATYVDLSRRTVVGGC